MKTSRVTRRITSFGATCLMLLTGCSFQGVNSLPLPGTVGRDVGSVTYHAVFPNVGTLEPNSPVMINDVIVGTVDRMTARDWHAYVDLSVRPDVAIPGNAVATVGQTSLLGSMHISLDPPMGTPAQGRLNPGTTLGLERTSIYPSTEQTLSTLSTLVNAGGLGQIGDIVQTVSTALSGRESQIRDLLSKLDRFVGIFDRQQTDAVMSLQALNRLAGTLNSRRDTITVALNEIPSALDVLLQERPRFTAALNELRTFSDTAIGVVQQTHDDLVHNLDNLGPTVQSLADIGPDIGTALAFLPVYPLGQNVIDRGVRGDYMNLFVTVDLTRNRFKRGLLAGTRWGDEDLPLVPAPGDPGYDHYYTTNPMGAPLLPPPPQAPRAPVPVGPAGAIPPGAPPPPTGPPASEGGR